MLGENIESCRMCGFTLIMLCSALVHLTRLGKAKLDKTRLD